MPYRHAYLWLLLLFPAVGVAFWPSYFSRLSEVSWMLHAHGIMASLWTALTALQAWSIHREQRSVHRAAGRASLFLFPLFWTSGLLIIQFMAAGFVARDNPFHAIYGARLAPVDAVTSVAVLYLYYVALRNRRSVPIHAAAMLAIPLFLLPPIFVRIMQVGGPFAIRGPDQFYKFAYGFEVCNGLSILIGLWLWSRRPQTAWPFLFAAIAIAGQGLFFETLGRTFIWESAMSPFAQVPSGVIAASGLLLSTTVIWFGWKGTVRKIGSGRAVSTTAAAGS